MDESEKDAREKKGNDEELQEKLEKQQEEEPVPDPDGGEEELQKKGAVKSLEILYKLWWIPLIVLVAGTAGLFAGLVLGFAGKSFSNPAVANAGAVFIILSVILIFFSGSLCVISPFILLYRYWKFLPATEAVTTPAKAVGYLFIPVFNLYWIFVAYGKLGSTMDALLKNKNCRCKQICYLYSLFFVLSAVYRFFSHFCTQFHPPWSKYANYNSIFVFGGLIVFIMMMIRLQKAFREYLKGPVSNWKDNPPYSLAPVGIGLAVAVIFSMILFLFYFFGGIFLALSGTCR